MELYLEKPSLVRAFYYKDASDFTCYHTHDMDLQLRRQNVIYLYHDPVEHRLFAARLLPGRPGRYGKAAALDRPVCAAPCRMAGT